MSNATLLAFNEAGNVTRVRNRLGTDISSETPVSSTDLANIRAALGYTVTVPELGWVNVQDYFAANGGAADGTTDCTLAVQAAYNALSALGGKIYFPPGRYCFNLTITKNNVKIEGASCVKDYNTPLATSYFRPANPSLPLIQVGNNSGYVRGFRIDNCTLWGGEGPTYGDIGVYFAGGAFECHLMEVTVWNFKTNLKFLAGANYPCSKIFVTDFNLQNAPVANARSIHAIQPTNAVSYTTAIYFANGNVDGPSETGSYAVEVDGVPGVSFTDVYLDLANGHGIKFSETNAGVYNPYIDCNGLTIDSNLSTDVLIECNREIRQHSWWFRGRCQIDGKMKMPSTTLIDPPLGSTLIAYQSQANFLQVVGEIALAYSGDLNGYDNTRRILSDGHLWVINDGGHVKLKGSGGVDLDPGTGGVTLLGGGSGVVTFSAANLNIDNAQSIAFKDSLGTLRNILTSSGDGVAFTAGAVSTPGNINIAPTAALNLNPTTAINCTGGTNQAFNLSAGDFYMDNARALLFKDSGGTYRSALQANGNDIRVMSSVDIKLVPGNFAAAAGNVEVQTTKGAFILPKMTKAQRNALTATDGMKIYQTDNTPGEREYRNGAWVVATVTADP